MVLCIVFLMIISPIYLFNIMFLGVYTTWGPLISCFSGFTLHEVEIIFSHMDAKVKNERSHSKNICKERHN